MGNPFLDILFFFIGLGLIFTFIYFWDKYVKKDRYEGSETKLENLFFGIGMFLIVIFVFWLRTIIN